ncbi:MAG: polymer-forming cytoskeletal protein [Verrucomicrobiota bacterium]
MSSRSGAVLSEDVEFKGTLTFSDTLELNGKFEGEIIADGALTVGESAVIKGNITSKATVLLKGKMQGNIDATDRVEVTGSAQLFGDVKAPKFSLKEGAVFVGTSNTSQGKKSAEFDNIFSKLEKGASTSSAPAQASKTPESASPAGSSLGS